MSKRWAYKVVEVKPQWLGIKPKQIEETLAPHGQQESPPTWHAPKRQ